MSSVWRKPNQIIQPFWFGHNEPKKTCLWLKNLPRLNSRIIDGELVDVREPEYTVTKSGKNMATWYYYADRNVEGGRAETRSNTFSGIAQAMAEAWTRPELITTP